MMKWLWVSAAALVLTACGGAPSESEMQAVLEKRMNADLKALGSMGIDAQIKVHSLKKVGCKEDGEKAYKCDVEIDIEAPAIGRQQNVTPMRFVKSSDGWTVTR